MKKFQVTIQFEIDDEFMALVPSHRQYVNTLIEKGIIDQCLVSMETKHSLITFTAENKKSVIKYLSKYPLYKYWTYHMDEPFLFDGQHYRLPVVQLN